MSKSIFQGATPCSLACPQVSITPQLEPADRTEGGGLGALANSSEGLGRSLHLSGCFRMKETEIPLGTGLNTRTVPGLRLGGQQSAATPPAARGLHGTAVQASPPAAPTSEQQQAVVSSCSSCSKVKTFVPEISSKPAHKSCCPCQPPTHS